MKGYKFPLMQATQQKSYFLFQSLYGVGVPYLLEDPLFRKDLCDVGWFLYDPSTYSFKYGDTKSARGTMLWELKDLIEANPLFLDKLQFLCFKNSRLKTLFKKIVVWTGSISFARIQGLTWI